MGNGSKMLAAQRYETSPLKRPAISFNALAAARCTFSISTDFRLGKVNISHFSFLPEISLAQRL
jgi:hypothetical protein